MACYREISSEILLQVSDYLTNTVKRSDWLEVRDALKELALEDIRAIELDRESE